MSDLSPTIRAEAGLIPTADAGTDIRVGIPTSTVTLTGAGTDPQGGAVTFKWKKKSGGNAVITTHRKAQTTVTELEIGTYVFELKVTDETGLSATDTVTVVVHPNIPYTWAPGFETLL